MNNKDLSRFYPDNLEGSSEFIRREEVNELANSKIKSISHPTYDGFEIEYETGLKVFLPIYGGTGMSVDMTSTQTKIQIALDKAHQHLAAHMIEIEYNGIMYSIYLISQNLTPCSTLDDICYAQGDWGLAVNGYAFYNDGSGLQIEKYSFHELGDGETYTTYIDIGSTSFDTTMCTITDNVAQCY